MVIREKMTHVKVKEEMKEGDSGIERRKPKTKKERERKKQTDCLVHIL